MRDDVRDNSAASLVAADYAVRHQHMHLNIFFFAAVFCVAIPGFATLKAAVIFLTWLSLAITTQIRTREVLWLLSVVLSLAFGSEIALIRGVAVADVVNHLSRFILFFLVLAIGIWIARSNGIGKGNTDTLLLVIAVLSAILKIAILAVVASGRFSLGAVQTALGFESVTDNIGFGIQRLQFPSDIILIFLTSCYWGRRKISSLVFLVSVTICVFLSFSRYLFVAYLACLLIRYIRIRRLDLISTTALVISPLLILLFSVSLVNRFGGEGTKVSDNTREEQIHYLSEAVSEHTLIGSGVGSSVNDYKRSESIPFLYEVQWYAMAMQLGLIGLLWFFINLMVPLIDSIHSNQYRTFCFAVTAVWMAGGFTNPFVISLGSAFGFAILMITLAQGSAETPQYSGN